MTKPLARVLDASALVALFGGQRDMYNLLEEAEAGRVAIGVPAAAIVDAEHEMRADTGWTAILRTAGVQVLPLEEQAAIEIGRWPGSVAARHVVHEARALGATVVTGQPDTYRDLVVPLLVI